jgi:LAS superfamily LD-carboxypeptidase LdcB
MNHLMKTAPRAVAALVLLLVAVLLPTAARADSQSQRAEVQRKRAAVAAEIDTLKATDAQVEAALRTLNANVESQTASLRDAERRSAEADAALEAATAEVRAKEAQIVELDTAVKELAIAAYIQPPSSAGLVDSLAAENIGEAELKQSLLEAKSSNQLDVLDQLERAREDLETARANAEQAAVVAENNRNAVATKLDQVTQARNQQAKVAADVQSRLDRRLIEAQGLADLDAKLSADILAEQKRIAALAAQRSSSRSGGGGPISITGSGSIVSVRGIRVHKSIADQLARMLAAADSAGISLSGGGYRDPAGQIAVRRANCGTSNYAVYQMPASQCSPPTARPGQSMHERGLAIDFTHNGRVINSRSSPAFQWLRANAAGYGFYNLPSEPWHWSVNGN